MSNLEKIFSILTSNKTVFLFDDFNDVVCKLVPENEKVKAFVKFKGKGEYEISLKANLVLDIQMGGKFVDEKFYNEY